MPTTWLFFLMRTYRIYRILKPLLKSSFVRRWPHSDFIYVQHSITTISGCGLCSFLAFVRPIFLWLFFTNVAKRLWRKSNSFRSIKLRFIIHSAGGKKFIITHKLKDVKIEDVWGLFTSLSWYIFKLTYISTMLIPSVLSYSLHLYTVTTFNVFQWLKWH